MDKPVYHQFALADLENGGVALSKRDAFLSRRHDALGNALRLFIAVVAGYLDRAAALVERGFP